WPRLIKPTEHTCEQQRMRNTITMICFRDSCFDRRSVIELGDDSYLRKLSLTQFEVEMLTGIRSPVRQRTLLVYLFFALHLAAVFLAIDLSSSGSGQSPSPCAVCVVLSTRPTKEGIACLVPKSLLPLLKTSFWRRCPRRNTRVSVRI